MPSVTVTREGHGGRILVGVERAAQLAERAGAARRRRRPRRRRSRRERRWPSPCTSVRGVTSATARPCPSHSGLPPPAASAAAPGVAARNAPPTRAASKRPRAMVRRVRPAGRLGPRDQHALRLREHVVAEAPRGAPRARPSRLALHQRAATRARRAAPPDRRRRARRCRRDQVPQIAVVGAARAARAARAAPPLVSAQPASSDAAPAAATSRRGSGAARSRR